ncbi:MAG: 50S ribosomal protein L22, partial [Vicinamibacterales bacterium]
RWRSEAVIEAQATARGIRTSAQKAGLVCTLIRGKGVNQALAMLQFTRKTIARELAKVLRSAVANVQQKDGFSGDVERLYVAECYANQGTSMKRVRPAPMGRAFRVTKRTAHLTVRVAERPLKIARVADEADTTAKPGRVRKAGGESGAKKAARKAAATA